MRSALLVVIQIACLLSAAYAATFVTKSYTNQNCAGTPKGFSSFYVASASCTPQSCQAVSGIYYTLECDSAELPPADMPRTYLYPDDTSCSFDSDTNFYGSNVGFCFYVYHPQDPTFAVMSSCGETGVVAYSGASNSSCSDGAQFTFPVGCSQATIGGVSYGTSSACTGPAPSAAPTASSTGTSVGASLTAVSLALLALWV